MSKRPTILVGYEAKTAKEARVPLFHMILTGITQHGKTEEIRRAVTEAQGAGYTILILDVKDKPVGEKGDFEDFGEPVRVYLAGIAETLSIYGLLESHSGLPLRRELPELARACKKGKTLKGAFNILKDLLKQEKIHPVTKDRIEILVLVLEGLIAEMEKSKPSSKMELKKGQINVMNLRGWSSGFKQLAVNDAVAWIRRHIRKCIIVFDEAHQQIPQGYGSGSKKTVTAAIKEGAGSQQYIWVADQTIKEVDKDVIAQIPIKIYGGQPGAKLRAKETLDHLPVKSWQENKITPDLIMQLKTGFFLLGERERTRLIYTLPLWMPAALGRLVAAGHCSWDTAKEICDRVAERRLGRAFEIREVEVKPDDYDDLKAKVKDIDELNKELQKLQDLKARVEGLDLEDLKQVQKLSDDLTAARKRTKLLQDRFEERLEAETKELKAENERLRNRSIDLEQVLDGAKSELAELKDDLKAFYQLKEIFASMLPATATPAPAATAAAPTGEAIPTEISVTTEQPIISLKVERPTLSLKDEDLTGKIAVVYAEGKLGEGWFTVTDVNKAFMTHAWPRDPRASKFLDQYAQWGYFEKKFAGRKPMYRVILTPEEAKAKGLLKMEDGS